jgi:DHA1 family multidrug resistance protein-like MFS transporter
MKDIFRDSTLGQIIRFVTRGKVLPYLENIPGFTIPESFNVEKRATTPSEAITPSDIEDNDPKREDTDVEAQRTINSNIGNNLEDYDLHLHRSSSIKTSKCRHIVPTVTRDGKILVTWYTTDDSENPQNWSTFKKCWVALIIWYVSNYR